jgi:DNA-binding beta-propeller fold protein YncE
METLMRIRSLLLIAFCFLTAAAFAAQPPAYRLANTYPIGGEGGWDYLTYDADGHRLFISRGTHVMVVDAASGKVTGDIPNTPGAHGIALAPKLGRGFISDGGDNTVTIFDLKDLHTIGTVKVGDRPDAILYEPATQRVFTFNARSHDATAVDAAAGTVAGTVALGGKPEFAQADGTGHVFVNIEDKSELAVFDAKSLEVQKHIALAPCEEPSGLALDVKAHRLFAGCSNKLMAVVDPDAGRVVTTLPIGAGVDANAFDPGLHLAFSSNGSGTLTIVQAQSGDKYSVAQDLETARGARTMALDPQSHRVYLVTADYGQPPAPTAERPNPRPPIVPNSFRLLVAEPVK